MEASVQQKCDGKEDKVRGHGNGGWERGVQITATQTFPTNLDFEFARIYLIVVTD